MSAGAGGIDWIERWRQMVEATASPSDDDDPWRHRAARFDRVGRERADLSLERLRDRVRPTDLVADIGAGTGRHAVPISRCCAGVVAVEPSAAMRARLQARVDEERVRVTVVAERWRCAIPPVDVVCSCHVLYGVADAAAFLERMTRSARRSCTLLRGLRAPSDRLAPLWRAVHGVERSPRPAALEALALLHQLGHDASLQVVAGSERPMTFAPTDDDLDELCHRLRLRANATERARVGAALDALFPRSSADEPWSLGTGGAHALIEWPGGALS